ncbi:MAG: M48 family metallopeptidase [bacterium]|nr:M48 family metallopeptidase [bacterium]
MFTSEFYFYLILTVLTLDFLLENLAKLLNLSRLKLPLPEEFQDIHSEESYRISQEYSREKTKLSLLSSFILFPLQILFIVMGGFQWVDQLARSFGFQETATGLIFFGVLYLIMKLISLPFSIYSVFVIEEKYGFNRTSWKTFVIDEIKGIVLTLFLGGLTLTIVIWFFGTFGPNAWLPVWFIIIVIALVMIFLYPILFAPLFNKFSPLSDGELKTAIEKLSDQLQFKRQGLFTMDGSKRSTKTNAYFTGFGRFRRIVLFDTLIEKHPIQELLAVLAHEIGHYKMKHVVYSMLKSFVIMGFWLWLFSKFLYNQPLFEAFQMKQISVYASLVFFSFLMSPISTLLGILLNWISRRNEFSADRFAAMHTNAVDMIAALKRLSKDNLSNLTPHPLLVWLDYDHPPVLERIKALKQLQ